MRYCYGIPASITSTVHGTGAAFQTDVRLTNGQPSDVTVISWLTAETPATTDYVDLRMSWPAARQIRTLMLLGLSCGAGVLIEATGRRAEDAGYTYDLEHATQRTVELPDGRVAWIVELADDLDTLIGVQFRIFNDRNSATWATAATDLSIGEARPWRAVTIRGRAGWARTRNDPSEHADTLSGGEHTAVRTGWRTLNIQLAPEVKAIATGSGMEDSQDWETLTALSAGSSRALVLVDRTDATQLHRTAAFGRPQWSEIKQRPDATPLYESAIRVREIR